MFLVYSHCMRAILAGGGTGVGPGAGAVEAIHSLPMGAVRLTERFGGAERAAGARYEKMNKAIAEAL